MKRVVIVVMGVLMGALAIFPLASERATAVSGNLIANASMETAFDATRPDKWNASSWGANTVTTSYPATGYTGGRSVRIDMTAHTNGDAKWYFDPVSIVPNKSYKYTDYYQANVTTEIVVRFTHENGAFSYAWLGSPGATVGWTQSGYTFTTPSTARQATVFHLISKAGSLAVDEASLKESTPPTSGANMVANPSVEAALNSTRPQKWSANAWGTNNTTFSYPTEGRTGARSIKTQITNFTDGDTKWYFDPVTVQPNMLHTFSDYYKSDVETQVMVRYTNENGAFSYAWLGSVPASASWQKAAFSFKTPPTARKATVFHLLSSVGSLRIDDVHLAATPLPNPVPNPSLELSRPDNSSLPNNWTQNSWGNNTATFNYVQGGHTGSRSVKVTVSNHTDGDAKWYFTPQPLDAGKMYRFSAWYKTNTTPRVTAMYVKAGGTTEYVNLPITQPSGSTTAWQLYTETFSVPQGVQAVSIFMYLDKNGWVQTDDYVIEPHQPTGFSRPLVSLTFDDGFEENVTTALPVLNSRNFKSTHCFATKYIKDTQGANSNVLAFYNSGHEICSHSVTHPFLTQLSSANLLYELAHSKEYLEGITGTPVRNFASPYGDYNATVNQAIELNYRSHRTVDTGYNAKDNFDMYRIRVQNLTSSTTLAEYQSWLNYAKQTNTWLVLVYHRIATDTTLGQFDTRATDFAEQMQALASTGLTVKTYNDALDELRPQLQ